MGLVIAGKGLASSLLSARAHGDARWQLHRGSPHPSATALATRRSMERAIPGRALTGAFKRGLPAVRPSCDHARFARAGLVRSSGPKRTDR
jgi:hypothetical protein